MRHTGLALTIALASVLFGLLTTGALAQPQIVNPSFEADSYDKSPGLVRQHGGKLTGWQTGGNAGLNPVWKNPAERKGPDSPFWDNGKIPHGRQLALIQGPGKLSQMIKGFKEGGRYQVTYRENARVQRQGDGWPHVRVTLGGKVIVSAHEVTPVGDAKEFSVPFCRVVSAVFTAPKDGEYELVLETVQELATTTILLDDVRITQLPATD